MKAQVGSILIILWSLQKPKLIIVTTPPLHLFSQVFIHSCPCHVLPHLSGHKGFLKPSGKGEGSILYMARIGTPWKAVNIHMYQVIQAVTFVYPNVGGHRQPLKVAWFHHPKSVTKTCRVYCIKYCHDWSKLTPFSSRLLLSYTHKQYPSWN